MDLSPSKPPPFIEIGTVGVAQRCLVRSRIPTLSVQPSGPSASVNIGTVGLPSGAINTISLTDCGNTGGVTNFLRELGEATRYETRYETLILM